MNRICVISDSALVSDKEAAAMTGAVAAQVTWHAAPAWQRAPAEVQWLPGGNAAVIPPGAGLIAIVDDIPGQGTGILGYHAESGGHQIGVVAARPELDNGAQMLTGDWSVSSVLSHEVLEMLIDPACNLWAGDGRGRAWALEVCDPCEAPSYELSGVSVANFVLPAWFDRGSPAGARHDYLGLISEPFAILPGGYAVWEGARGIHQVYGEEFPEWRRAMKRAPTARTERRGAQNLA